MLMHNKLLTPPNYTSTNMPTRQHLSISEIIFSTNTVRNPVTIHPHPQRRLRFASAHEGRGCGANLMHLHIHPDPEFPSAPHDRHAAANRPQPDREGQGFPA